MIQDGHGKKNMARMKMKYPDDMPDYKHLQQCLKALKEGRIVLELHIWKGQEINREKWLKKKREGKW